MYSEDGAQYYAVAVVKKVSSLRWPNLKAAKSCHTGVNKTSGWIVPIGSLVERGQIVLDKQCDVPKGKVNYQHLMIIFY